MARVIAGSGPKKPRTFGTTPEGKVKTRIAQVLHRVAQSYAISHYCPVPCGYGQAGVADFVGCFEGSYFEIEAKASGGVQSALQKHHQQEVEASGGCYLLITPDNVEELYDAIIAINQR